MAKRDRVVFTVTGSKSDDPQTKAGEKILAKALTEGMIKDLSPELEDEFVEGLGELGMGHYTLSCHRHPEELAEFFGVIDELSMNHPDLDFILVMAAGWAAALPGVTAGYLYRGLNAVNAFVVGVALEDLSGGGMGIPGGIFQLAVTSPASAILDALSPKQRRDLAAILSVTELPDGGRVACRDEEGLFIGAQGFERACMFALNWEIPEDAELRKPPESLPENKQPGFRPWVA